MKKAIFNYFMKSTEINLKRYQVVLYVGLGAGWIAWMELPLFGEPLFDHIMSILAILCGVFVWFGWSFLSIFRALDRALLMQNLKRTRYYVQLVWEAHSVIVLSFVAMVLSFVSLWLDFSWLAAFVAGMAFSLFLVSGYHVVLGMQGANENNL